jgi:hypothetical protein
VVFTTVAAVGQVGSNGLAPRLRGGGWVARIRLNLREDGPGLPRCGSVAEGFLAFDRPADLRPGVVQPEELAEVAPEVAPHEAFVYSIADLYILVRGLPVEGHRFFRAVEHIVI